MRVAGDFCFGRGGQPGPQRCVTSSPLGFRPLFIVCTFGAQVVVSVFEGCCQSALLPLGRCCGADPVAMKALLMSEFYVSSPLHGSQDGLLDFIVPEYEAPNKDRFRAL